MAQLTLQPSCLETSVDVADSMSVRFLPTSPPPKTLARALPLAAGRCGGKPTPPEIMRCACGEKSASLSGGCLDKKKEIKSTVSGKIRILQASSTVLDTQQLHHTSFRPHPQPGAGSTPDHRPVFVTCGRLQQSLGFSSKLKSGCRQTAKHVFWRIS